MALFCVGLNSINSSQSNIEELPYEGTTFTTFSALPNRYFRLAVQIANYFNFALFRNQAYKNPP